MSGVTAATCLLEILWVLVALVVAAMRRRATSVSFRVIFVLNGIVFLLLIRETYRELQSDRASSGAPRGGLNLPVKNVHHKWKRAAEEILL